MRKTCRLPGNTSANTRRRSKPPSPPTTLRDGRCLREREFSTAGRRGIAGPLRTLGHDVLTSQEAGRANQMVPDEEVLRFAVEQGRAVLTLNRLDFFRLHRDTGGQHMGIIACTRDDADPARFSDRIDAVIGSVESLEGQLLRVVRPST